MILTVTLNASVDKAYHMTEGIQDGSVMRVASCRNSAGGKGLNVARIVRLCGAKVAATGFTGGHNGAYLEELLTADGIPHRFAHVAGETRCCLNILDPVFSSTEYLEPGCTIARDEEANFLTKLFPDVLTGCDVVTLSGSIPQGLAPDIYARMTAIARKAGKKVILDTSGEPLKAGIEALPTMIKPNADEMEMLTGRPVKNRDDLIAQAGALHDKGIPTVVISMGGDGALMVCEDGVFTGRPPKIDVVNTVGCGDSMVGAFAVAMERGLAPEEQLRYAVAVSAANALSPATGSFKQQDFEGIFSEVVVCRH